VIEFTQAHLTGLHIISCLSKGDLLAEIFSS